MLGNCCDTDDIYGLVADIFLAAAITCFLYAMHRIADGIVLGSRVKVYDHLEEAFTPEEREVLVHKIKTRSLHYL